MLLRLSLLVVLLVAFVADVAVAGPLNTPSHMDKQKLRFGCGSCHVGFDFKAGGGIGGCFSCHGSETRGGKVELTHSPDMKNVQSDLRKTFHHPVFETAASHSAKEVLPEVDPKAPRHVSCVDCHDPHLSSPENKLAAVSGRKFGRLNTEVTKEFQLCYRCHGDSANLPGRSTNKKQLLATANASFHPVEGEGRNTVVISLIKPYRERKVSGGDVSTITCSDCHGSEDPSSPRGPHGSVNQFILVENYSTRDKESETSQAYALCYRCHSRTSILGDESFKYHSLHIRGKGAGMSISSVGTSCYTCHDSHGSTENKYLIRFNPEVVSPNANGALKYVSKGIGAFRGECYLSCHGVNHNPKTY